MERQLKFVLSLSLKEMVLRRVAVLLSNDFEIPAPLANSLEWRRWHNTNKEKVKYKISKLLLPESLRKEMIDKERPISLEIRKWIYQHRSIQISTREIDIPAKLFWTSEGTVDYKRTAEALVGCEVLDVEERFSLACTYCLEDYIPLLWEGLAVDRKEYFLNETSFCWPRILRGEFSDLDRLWRGSDRNLTSFNQWAFEDSARENSKSVAEYFFLKLTHEERDVSLMRATLYVLSESPRYLYFENRYAVLFYLLSLLTLEQQMETIKEHPVDVLVCFFVMSWQDLLVENAGLIWPFLPSSRYVALLNAIIWIFLSSSNQKSFQEFFIMSPLDFKKYIAHHESSAGQLLDVFFFENDSEAIKCIFRNVDAADRAAIVFQPDVLNLFRRQGEDKRHLLEVCLREAKLSKEDRERLKKERPYLRRVIEELYESDATAEKEKNGGGFKF